MTKSIAFIIYMGACQHRYSPTKGEHAYPVGYEKMMQERRREFQVSFSSINLSFLLR